MQPPAVNILVPTYKPLPEHLKAALDSILAQTFTQWTVLIHDDPSSVDTAAIVQPYLADPRFSFAKSPKRLGIAGNWNACLQQAQAPYVQFLFQDDTWEPEYLQTSVEAMEVDPALVFTAANHVYLDDDGQAIGGTYATVQAARAQLLQPGKIDGHAFLMDWIRYGLHPNLIGEPSFVLMRTDAVRAVGIFNTSMPQCLDLEYWTRLLQRGDWFSIHQSLGMFRVHPAAASAANESSGAGITDRLRCLLALKRSLPAQEDRMMTKKVLNTQAQSMVAKFFQRTKSGKSAGSGSILSLPVSAYPVLLRALLLYLINRAYH